MTEHTAEYLMLKPIAERIVRTCDEITDNELYGIIKDAIKFKVSEVIGDLNYDLSDIVSTAIDNNKDEINTMIKESLIEKLGLTNKYGINWNDI